MAKKDYYDILGVNKNASDEDLKSAYRKKAMASHPDRNPNNPKAEQEFKEINEAYEVLRDKQKRAAYDQFGHAAFQQGGGGGGPGFGQGFQGFSGGFPDINEIFEQMFGGGFAAGRGGGQQRESRGRDRNLKLKISLVQAFHGEKIKIRTPKMNHCEQCGGNGAEKGSKPITCKTCGGAGVVRMAKGFFSIEQTCHKCHGSGQIIEKLCKACGGQGLLEKNQEIEITIPAGIDDHHQVRVAGKGDDAPGGKKSGDLFLHVDITPHDIFQRHGHDIFCLLPIDPVVAMVGGEIPAPTIDGQMVMVKIDKGVQHNQQLRLKGKGMVVLNSGGRRGDLILQVMIETPRHLTRAQESLLQKFQEESNTDKQFPAVATFRQNAKKFIDNYRR